MRLSEGTLALSEDTVRTRRELHRIPESAYEEFETQKYVTDSLKQCFPDSICTLAGTGVKAVWYTQGAQRTVAFRADMDALVCEEENDVDYRSVHKCRMHGCGHDGHMTVLLMLARLIHANRKRLSDNVVLIFQPAEEGYGGAKRAIADGALVNPSVDIIYGEHLWPALPKGKIGIRWGAMMAQACELDFTVYGVSAHGASPQLGVDAVVVAAQFISLLQTAITRSLDPHQDALLTIGKISGGSARNIISDKVVMNATLRAFSPEVYRKLMDRICAIADGLGVASGARLEITELMQYPCLDNPRALVEDFYRFVDMEDIVLVEPAMAAEDFACYQQKAPGLFFFLGVGGGKNSKPLHNSLFDFDEDALLNGVEIFARLLGINNTAD